MPFFFKDTVVRSKTRWQLSDVEFTNCIKTKTNLSIIAFFSNLSPSRYDIGLNEEDTVGLAVLNLLFVTITIIYNETVGKLISTIVY